MTGLFNPPYYAVVFSSVKDSNVAGGYGQMAARMEELAARQPGYLGMETVRDDSGRSITISYWQSEHAIASWRDDAEHQIAQQRGRADWYDSFEVRVCKVEREYSWGTASGLGRNVSSRL